jgi:hypothetical protein
MEMVKYKKWWVLLLIILFVACAAGQKPYSEYTPTEKLSYFYQIYNAQHEDYVAMVKMPNLTDGQKMVLRTKKPILEELQKLLPIYDRSVVAGTPSVHTEQAIYNYLNQLQSLVPIN